MKEEPVDKFFGVPLSEWIKKVPNELSRDAVGLWQIIPAGRESFGLSGDDLKDMTKRCINALLERGAVPARASAQKGVFWEHDTHYGSEPQQIAENIIREWEQSGVDPDHDGLWFALIDGCLHA